MLKIRCIVIKVVQFCLALVEQVKALIHMINHKTYTKCSGATIIGTMVSVRSGTKLGPITKSHTLYGDNRINGEPNKLY